MRHLVNTLLAVRGHHVQLDTLFCLVDRRVNDRPASNGICRHTAEPSRAERRLASRPYCWPSIAVARSGHRGNVELEATAAENTIKTSATRVCLLLHL